MISQEERYTIADISWERVFLSFEIRTLSEKKTVFWLERMDDLNLERVHDIRLAEAAERIRLKPAEVRRGEGQGGVCYSFCCNISAMNKRSFLNNGEWKISAETEDGKQVCLADHAAAYRFDLDSRTFRYGKNRYAYTINFKVYAIEDKELAFVLCSYFMESNSRWKKRYYVHEARTAKGKAGRLMMTTGLTGMRSYYRIAEQVRKKDGKHILLMSETHDYLWGNLKAIDAELKRQGMDQTYHISYSFRKQAGQKQSFFSWLKLVTMIAGQDYIFVDDYCPIFGYLNPGRKTKLIQVWHAGEGFKAVGYCRFGRDGSPFPTEICHKNYDYVLTGSEKLVKVFAEVFGIEEEAFLPVGMPRLDGFLDQERILSFRKKFYQEYPQFTGKKLILFAPTYRGTSQKTAYYDYSWLDWKQIYDYCGEDRIFLLKMHPFVTQKADVPEEYKDRIVEFSFYPDINDLYYVSDLLITDYSSNYFEYSLLKRPCLFYTPDRELYELSRGVHRDVRSSAPGKVCDSFEELMDALQHEDYEVEKIERFVHDNFGSYDGKASERTAKLIRSNFKSMQ